MIFPHRTKSSVSTTPVAQGVLGDGANGEYASFPADNTPAMLQLNILLLHGLQRFPGPHEHNWSCQVKMDTWVQQMGYGIWEATGDASWGTGKKLWQTHSESNKRSAESEAALQNHFHLHWELIIKLGRLDLTISRVTVDFTVENSPKMYGGELAEAVEPSWLTQQIQKS